MGPRTDGESALEVQVFEIHIQSLETGVEADTTSFQNRDCPFGPDSERHLKKGNIPFFIRRTGQRALRVALDWGGAPCLYGAQ